ncbi:MAG: ribonuclease Z [Pseudomonadota bacterium]
MRPLLHPRLLNGRFGDPALYVECMFERWALLFDLGDLHGLDIRKLLRVRDVFVSHTHIDHFVGFDQLLRISIGREHVLRLFGPSGIIGQVEHRLGSYSWNLVERYATDLVIVVTEVRSPTEAESARFRFQNRFRREAGTTAALADGVLRDDSGFRVRCAVLDHRIPCLGFAVEERQHVNVWKNRLEEAGLAVGPWLREVKQAILRNEPDDTPCRVDWREGRAKREETLPLGRLKREVMRLVPGQKIGYVVDVAYSAENIRRIVELVQGADILFIEACFARKDAARAADRAHLTTEQAGRIARLAGVQRVEPFHFSPRYVEDGECLMREVDEAFRAPPEPEGARKGASVGPPDAGLPGS